MSKSLINSKAKGYVDRNPRLKGVVALYRDTYSMQRRLSERVPDQLPHIDGAQISYRLQENELLVKPDELEIDLQLLRDIMKELGGILIERSESPPRGLEDFLEKELEDEDKLRELVEAFVNRDEDGLSGCMDGYDIDPVILYLLLHNSLAPFYWKMAATLARKADLDQLPSGTCPVCGDLPVMGFLRSEDGLRVLECSLCGSRWGVPRMMCPFCKTMDQDKLSYIFADESPSSRAYLCDGCHKYIKIATLPGEMTEEIVIPLEDLATLHLDQAAEERGYERGCRTVFS